MSQINRSRPSFASTPTSSLKSPAGEQAQGTKKADATLLSRGKDEFQAQAKASPLSGLKTIFGGNKAERANDGLFMGANGQTFPPGTPLKDIPGVTPPGNANPSKTILYVNGILTTASAQMDEMKAIAQTSGARVVGIHNSTQGIVSDLAECVGDKLDKGKNPAVDTLADTVYTELKAGREVHLMGYSQGGLITARALNDVQRRLRIEDGMSSAQVEKLMGKLSVETFGAASTRYPDGPQYVHYINNRDAVPVVAGLGGSVDPLAFAKDAGKGAVVHRFSEGGLNLLDNHMLNISYLKHRVPFEQARAGNF
ncbi:hypothetical protein [Myxococcus landrumensis]|uniref:DUF676 domain-containing protein n=1 Tax=Myxococcus landrumensis TaxID=2813577 RepID=A0ABX7N3E8_9BACT|nr:hypothetical protein [Myxococcus landrumus]QSQ13158.1 hypothetical protein JY572_33190 [Myxococcus landrumus]